MWFLSSILTSEGSGNFRDKVTTSGPYCYFCALTACLSKWWHSAFQLWFKTTVMFLTAISASWMKTQIRNVCLNLRMYIHTCLRLWSLTSKMILFKLTPSKWRSIRLEIFFLTKNLLRKPKTLLSRLWMKNLGRTTSLSNQQMKASQVSAKYQESNLQSNSSTIKTCGIACSSWKRKTALRAFLWASWQMCFRWKWRGMDTLRIQACPFIGWTIKTEPSFWDTHHTPLCTSTWRSHQ